ncbi:universal stress protein UspA [Tenuifilaceae bacterium CYCD]|nr:universal stress protein UspA [Tenuifilaceae bacterium CYCD]
MKGTNKTILVPTDFSKVAEYALQHAVRVSNVVKEPISILHIVQSENEVEVAKEKLNVLIATTKEKYGIEITPIVRIGSIFIDIAKVANEINASIVIMGSSTIKDMDESRVSWTLKVITSCKVPFVTIQEPPVNKRYDDVVFPIDFTTENREKHQWISYFCDYYLSRFHLIKPNTTDPELLAKIDINMASARKFLDQKGAKYIEYTVPGIKSYDQEILEMAVNIRADLIVLMTTPLDKEGEFIVDPLEQHILANARHIPVMSINPL